VSKLLSAMAVLALTLPMTACSSSGGPSDADVKKEIIAKVERQLSDENMKKTLKVDYIKCEPREIENEYMCLVTISMKVNGNREKETLRWKFTKANDAWFMKGPFPTTKAERELAEK
jgi:hypothetical protein